ncbi:MAG: thioredoxin [Gammaproteobacteria bacterium]|nr:thioredoxin [Gammaproteobacteria bacterium]
MAVIELNESNFQQTIDNNDIVIIDFWAPWCGPCRSFAPIYEKISEKHPDVVFAKLNTEDEQGLATQFNIRSIPTIALFREQIILMMQAGALPESALEDVIKRAQDLNMDDVRKEIAEKEAEGEKSA